jgi:hypothetical protein
MNYENIQDSDLREHQEFDIASMGCDEYEYLKSLQATRRNFPLSETTIDLHLKLATLAEKTCFVISVLEGIE